MIIDIRMPRINGFDLYRQVKKRDTGVKVLLPDRVSDLL
jgi:YesN/AraC family two-component response regulator